MKKFLLTFIVTMFAFVGTWAQASHSSYKFNAASDGETLFTDATGETPATYAANDPCVGTYYLQVNKQHTTAPATKDGPKTFNVKDYYVDGVCTYGQEYDGSNEYKTVATITEITDANKDVYVTSGLFWTAGAVNAGVHKSDLSGEYPADSGEPIVEGGVCDPDGHYWVNGGDQLGSTVAQYQNWSMSGIRYATESTAFKDEFVNNVYTLSDGIYTQIPTTAYDENETYYVVTFTDADPTAVAADANFETSKLYDLSGVSETIYHKNGTSYDVVVDGAPFIDDDEYYVDGTSYQPLGLEDLVTLNYATKTTTYYDCDVTLGGDQMIITYHAYGYNNFLDYFTDCAGDISGHTSVVVASDGQHHTQANVTKILEGMSKVTGVTNLVLSDLANFGKIDYDLSALSGSSVKRVILPSTTQRENFDGITNATPEVVLEVVRKDQWGDEKQVLVYSPTAGSLAAIKDAHYYSTDIAAADRQIYFGKINSLDVEWFNGVQVSQLDMSQLTHTTPGELTQIKNALHYLTNAEIQYVAFPDLEVKPEDALYTDFLANCPSVVAVGQFTSTDATLTAYTKQPGKVSIITDMLSDLTGVANAAIKHAKISGSLNAADLNGGSNVVDANGHYTKTGGTGTGALYGAQLVSLDLKDAEFYDYENGVEHYEDMTISAYGIFDLEAGYTQYVTLPTSEKVTIMPEECLKGIRELHELCIPYNIKEIRGSALRECGVEHITCTDALGDVIDYGEGTYALPPQLTFVGAQAFLTIRPENISDIYVLARIAPKCEQNAFDAKQTYGNNGFAGNGAHPIQRMNYKNGTNLITILHFPAGISDEQKKNYTDVTRKYCLADETGATNDDGELWMWPSHGQFARTYDQAIGGYTWDAWSPSMNINYAGQEGSEDCWDPTEIATTKTAVDALAAGHIIDATKTYNLDYIGWHEFLLVGSTNYNDAPDEPKKYWDFSKFKKQDWYTLCVPFDMTKDDLARVFGAKEHPAIYYTEKEIANAVPGDDAYGKTTGDVKLAAVIKTVHPEVITLAGVTRDVDNLHIQIQLSDNLISKKLVVNEISGAVTVNKDALTGKWNPVYEDRMDDPNEVVIKANEPYFIRPHLPEDEAALANAGKRAVEYTPLASTATQHPFDKHHVNVLDADQLQFLDWQDQPSDDVPTKPYKYYFVGTYLTQTMPQYAYYLGSKGGVSTMFRNTKDNKSWTQYTTIIGGVGAEGTGVSITGGAAEGKDVTNYQVVFNTEEDFTFNQDLSSQQQAKSFSYGIVTDEGETTGIMMPNYDGSMTFIPSNSKVYNMNGQFVGTSLENLGRGMYIVNGKKFIVK